MRRRLFFLLAITVWWLVFGPATSSYADNCSGLSDCSTAAKVGIAAAVALGLMLVAAIALPALVGAAAAEGVAAMGAADAAIATYGAADAAAVAASAAAEEAAATAAAMAEAAGEGLIAPEAAAAAEAAAAEANALAWEAAEAAEAAQAAAQESLAAAQAGDVAAAEAASAQAAQASAAAEAAAVNAERAAIQSEIAGVNPLGAVDNCTYCTAAAEDRFAGDLVSYAGDNGTRTAPDIADALGGTWQYANETGIKDALGAAGDGSRGVVAINWAGSETGHLINVVEQGGNTFFVDAQSGQVATSLNDLYPNNLISAIRWFMTAP